MLIYVWMVSAFWVAAFPVTHVVYPLVYFVYSIFLHFLFIPAFQVLKVLNYAFVYLPFKPVFYWMELGDPSVQTLVQTLPHFRFFVINMIHYLMVSAFFGVLVGVVTGLYLKVIQSMLTVEDARKQAHLRLVALSKKKSKSKPVPFVDEYLEKLNKPAVKREVPEPVSQALHNSLTFQNIVSNIASLVRGGRMADMTLGQNYTYEDDDGYNFSVLPNPHSEATITELHSGRELRRASIVTEPSIQEEDEDDSEDVNPLASDKASESSGRRSETSKNNEDVFSMRKRNVLDTTAETVELKP